MIQFDSIFFNWVETTNYVTLDPTPLCQTWSLPLDIQVYLPLDRNFGTQKHIDQKHILRR